MGDGMEVSTPRGLWRFVALALTVVGTSGCGGASLGRVEIAPARPTGLAWSDDLGEVIRENQAAGSMASAQPTPR